MKKSDQFKANKIRVRVAVAVDSTGHWYACGGSCLTEQEMKDRAKVGVSDTNRIRWVEQTIEL